MYDPRAYDSSGGRGDVAMEASEQDASVASSCHAPGSRSHNPHPAQLNLSDLLETAAQRVDKIRARLALVKGKVRCGLSVRTS